MEQIKIYSILVFVTLIVITIGSPVSEEQKNEVQKSISCQNLCQNCGCIGFYCGDECICECNTDETNDNNCIDIMQSNCEKLKLPFEVLIQAPTNGKIVKSLMYQDPNEQVCTTPPPPSSSPLRSLSPSKDNETKTRKTRSTYSIYRPRKQLPIIEENINGNNYNTEDNYETNYYYENENQQNTNGFANNDNSKNSVSRFQELNEKQHEYELYDRPNTIEKLRDQLPANNPVAIPLKKRHINEENNENSIHDVIDDDLVTSIHTINNLDDIEDDLVASPSDTDLLGTPLATDDDDDDDDDETKAKDKSELKKRKKAKQEKKLKKKEARKRLFESKLNAKTEKKNNKKQSLLKLFPNAKLGTSVKHSKKEKETETETESPKKADIKKKIQEYKDRKKNEREAIKNKIKNNKKKHHKEDVSLALDEPIIAVAAAPIDTSKDDSIVLQPIHTL